VKCVLGRRWRRKGRFWREREVEVSQKLRQLQVVTKDTRRRHHFTRLPAHVAKADVNGVVSLMASTMNIGRPLDTYWTAV
jgi:hypothetical protein